MRKTFLLGLIIISLIVTGFLGVVSTVEAQQSLQESDDIINTVVEEEEQGKERIFPNPSNLSRLIKELRNERKDKDFEKQIRSAVQVKAKALRTRKAEKIEQIREEYQEAVQQLSPEMRNRFQSLPDLLNMLNGQMVEKNHKRLFETEGFLQVPPNKVLKPDQQRELEALKEETIDLWEEMPRRKAKNYYEELEGVDSPEEVAPKAMQALQTFGEDKIDFSNKVKDTQDRAEELFTSHEYRKTVTLTSPQGDEQWEQGSTQEITWKTEGGVEEVKIQWLEAESLGDSGWSYDERSYITPKPIRNDGNYKWNIPSDFEPGQYAIQIIVEDDDYRDVSRPINIIKGAEEDKSISVTSPEEGEEFEQGDAIFVEWKSSGDIDNVRIETCMTKDSYSGGVGRQETRCGRGIVTDNDGHYTKETGEYAGLGDYIVTVENASDSSVYGKSGIYTITEKGNKAISRVSPSGGEQWEYGKPYQIRWRSKNVEEVDLLFSPEGSGNEYFISNVSMDPGNSIGWEEGTYKWEVKGSILERYLDSDHYGKAYNEFKIKVRDAEDKSISAVSSDTFNISKKGDGDEEKNISVTSPDGGEEWKVGNEYTVKWESEGIEKVNILLMDRRVPENCYLNTDISCTGDSRPQSCEPVPVSAESGSYSFELEEVRCFPGMHSRPMRDIEPGERYKVIVMSSEGSESAESDYFTIKPGTSTNRRCIDSDGGKDYSEKGVTKIVERTDYGMRRIVEKETDSCRYCTGACLPGERCESTCGAVEEYYCEDGDIKSETYTCAGECEDGACTSDIPTPSPDLTISDINKDIVNGTVNVEIDIKNKGEKEIKRGNGIPYRGELDGELIRAMDETCDRDFTGGLRPGESHTMLCHLGKVGELEPGRHKVRAEVDYSDEFQESNENNNEKTESIYIEGSEEESINVTTPDGGEEWKAGKNYDIQWSSSGIEEVDIFLARRMRTPIGGHGYDYTKVAKGVDADSGQYDDWTISQDVPTGGNFKILVGEEGILSNPERPVTPDRELDRNLVSDRSDGYFTIKPGTSTNRRCTDSDGGKDYSEKGVTKIVERTDYGMRRIVEKETDSCRNCTGACPLGERCESTCGAVEEYYCENGDIKSETHTCAGECEDGACIGFTPQPRPPEPGPEPVPLDSTSSDSYIEFQQKVY